MTSSNPFARISRMAKDLILEKVKQNSIEKYWLIWANAFIVLVGWAADITIPTLLLLSLETMVLFALSKNTVHVLGPLWMFLFTFAANSVDVSQNWWWFLMLLAPIAGIIVHIIRFKPQIFSKENIFKGFTISLILCVISTSFGGITMARDNWVPPVVICALFILFAFGYLFFTATTPNSKSVAEYIVMIMFTVGILLILQTIVVIARIGNGEQILEAISQKNLDYGWGMCNQIAPAICVSIPVSLYYLSKAKKLSFIFGIIATIEYLIILISGSRGVILVGAIVLLAALIYYLIITPSKLYTLVGYVTILFVFAIFFAALNEQLSTLFNHLINSGIEDNGRVNELWIPGLQLFKNHPLFGVGLDYRLGELKHNSYSPYWYHSTPIQILACFGVFGLITYAMLYYWRYKTFVLSIKNPLIFAILCACLIYDGYSWVDTGFFPPNSFIILLIMTLAADRAIEPEKLTLESVKLCRFIKKKLDNKNKKA